MKKEWSNIQKECYERNCNCDGCHYSQYNEKFKCQVKWSILKEIEKNGLKEGFKTKKWLEI